MGGPGASILLRRELTDAQINELVKTLHQVSSTVESQDVGDYNFWVKDARPIGGTYVGIGEPFAVTLYPPSYEGGVSPLVEAEFELETRQVFQLNAFCKGHHNSLILGALALYFAELYDGIIDFQGALLPEIPNHFRDWEADWAEVKSYFDDMVRAISGRIISVEYEPMPGRTWAYHVADAEFMRAWLHHPNFHMIR